MSRRTVGPAVAGTWYPDDPVELARLVDELFARAPRPADSSPPAAVIAPHAGYVYSGAVAAHGFAAVLGRSFRRVVLLGPSHYVGFPGLAVPDAAAYLTPLGPVPIDAAAVTELRGRPGFRVDSGPFAREHSLESELPFLQRALRPGWEVVPILTGSRITGATADRLSEVLVPLLGPETLVVVSSDFTHYGRAFGYVPFHDQIETRLRALDLGAVDRITGWDPDGFEEYVERTGATICGRDAIGLVLRIFPSDTRARLAAYDNSGRMTGDWSHAVSYAAVVAGAATPA